MTGFKPPCCSSLDILGISRGKKWRSHRIRLRSFWWDVRVVGRDWYLPRHYCVRLTSYKDICSSVWYPCKSSLLYPHSTIHFRGRIRYFRLPVGNQGYRCTIKSTGFYNKHQKLICTNLEKQFHEMEAQWLSTSQLKVKEIMWLSSWFLSSYQESSI